jgi:hypothetical protein
MPPLRCAATATAATAAAATTAAATAAAAVAATAAATLRCCRRFHCCHRCSRKPLPLFLFPLLVGIDKN